MEEIIINGINLNELSVQIKSIRQEASVLISQSIDLAKKLTKELVHAQTKEEIEEYANRVYAALKKASFISDVSGVKFSLPYNSSYNGYYDENTLSAMLEDSENTLLNDMVNQSNELRELLNLTYDMEYQSKHWDSSVC